MKNKVTDIYQSWKGYRAISRALGIQQTTLIHKWPKRGTGRKLLTDQKKNRKACLTFANKQPVDPQDYWENILWTKVTCCVVVAG